MVSLTVPFSLIWGLTRRVRPTSLRSKVWNGLTVPLVEVPVLENWPVRKGTFWPMTILASSLSRVSRLGVEGCCRPAGLQVARQKAQHVDAVDPLAAAEIDAGAGCSAAGLGLGGQRKPGWCHQC